MKKYLSIILMGLLIFSCEDDFNEINTDPNRSDAGTFDANLILGEVLAQRARNSTGYAGSILFQSMWTQSMASTSSGGANYYSNADKYVPSSSTVSYIQGVWNGNYEAASRAFQMKKLTQDDPNLSNLGHVADIMRVLLLGFVTDIYGDAPYSEALQGEDGITRPVYDAQQAFYNAMLADLETAALGLDASGPAPTNDPLYDGDVEKWRKLAYSFMLKHASRLINADPATAQEYMSKAIAGGIFEGPEDEAVLPMDPVFFRNRNAEALNTVDDLYEVRWSNIMIDYLIANNDPRLGIVAEIPPAGITANFDPNLVGDSDTAIQIGMPNGFDLNGGGTDITNEPNYPGPTGAGDDAAPIGAYSRPTAMYRNLGAPTFLLTYGELQLILADAAVRGFTTPSSAAVHYANGLTGAMQSMASYGDSAVIPDGDIAAYVAANPLDTSSEAASLEQINWQFWASTGLMFNFVETWTNWRRTELPVLDPVDYPNSFSGGQIPLRQVYPASETGTNPDNLAAAISNIGGDTWTTRVWWDQ
ncbi:MAG: SusD/RagB family nutrient-binding outer membrane lipoprotein [Bacteroidota bacterium]